jgi:hypothetical protein
MARGRNQPLTCPHCGSNKYKTLKKGGVTRCCGNTVVTVNHKIYKELNDAPEWTLLQKFAEMKRGNGDPNYTIEHGDYSYQESVRAARALLKHCGGDLNLAFAVIDVCFTHKSHRWRTYSSFFCVLAKRWWPGVLAAAKAQVAGQRRKQHTQEGRIRSADLRQLELAYGREGGGL